MARSGARPYAPVMDALVESLRQFTHVERVILFGSRARGDYEERSDIDLAIDISRADSREWSAVEEIAENARTLLKIDLVNLSRASSDLKHRILTEGITLYERPKAGENPGKH
ncbi:MAG: nucleotidyltransferase domain-containing protein [Armatimonadetes bacterium]|nr:nucleotidyltransferase domain-containing protein [Armatimonadota bacterium]